MNPLIISVSGLRGIVGESLTPEVAARFCQAFSAVQPSGPLILTRDTRVSGPMLAGAIRAGLAAVGRDVIDADVAATPTTGVLVRQYQAAGGIQISASHNPAPYNGIKLFDAQGQVLSAELGQRVVEQYRDSEPPWVAYDQLGHVTACHDPLDRHLQLVLDTIEVERVRQQKFRVLLDSNHGAGSLLGRRLLEQLGCQIEGLGLEPDGAFAHPPEPTAENLAEVARQVADRHAVIGFCQDPDADRLAVIDEGGRYLGEEYTLAICLNHVLKQRKGPIVTNCATSRMAADLARKHNVAFHRSAVGEANVVQLMRHVDAVFGGEGNGGPIDPRVGMIRDSFVGMALILNAMAERQVAVSALADELPRYEIHKTKVTLLPEKIPAALAALQKHFADAQADPTDGLRLDWDDRWLLVRASNTEPIVRIIAEAPHRAQVEKLCAEAAEVIDQRGG